MELQLSRCLAKAGWLAILTTVFFGWLQMLLGSWSLWLHVDYWTMAGMALGAVFVGYWFYCTFSKFWAQRDPRLPYAYGLVIILGYVSFVGGYHLLFPEAGGPSVQRSLAAWCFLLAGIGSLVMVGPLILPINAFLKGKKNLRAGLGIGLIVIFMKPYYAPEPIVQGKPRLLISARQDQSPFRLQGVANRANQTPQIGFCTPGMTRLWQQAFWFAPFYWFFGAPLTGKPICLSRQEVSADWLAEVSWSTPVVLVWPKPDWTRLPGLRPKVEGIWLRDEVTGHIFELRMETFDDHSERSK
jgi:hypothetical protein